MFKAIDKRELEICRVNETKLIFQGNEIAFKSVPKKCTIYGVKYKNGYPYFTLYKNGRWVTESAKYYIPVEE